ncbi:hypothetical protein LTR37_020542 [Vermiconidia calcicola]|uniref:Uncharacterized protein n=1 Tax=Vermiconidia calcicola TaxID=1690605 RepID=A0ACC3ME25_9PEZI|nr:hypothetical protein LTR37_020542 [Vermiconidia calcicola]
MRETLFGSKKSGEVEKQEERSQQKSGVLAKQAEQRKGPEKRQSRSGRTYEVAKIVHPTETKDYVRSNTWAGLETVGTEEWVRAKLDRGEKYNGFTPTKRATLTNAEWMKLLHHVAVEVLILHQVGRDLKQVCYPRVDGAKTWRQTKAFDITSENGAPHVTSSAPQAPSMILQAVLEKPGSEQDQSSLAREVKEVIAMNMVVNSEASWMRTTLRDANIRFAITKRLVQLTGKRIPDVTISNATTLEDLFNAFKTKEQPKKLSQTEQLRGLAARVPNVKVSSKRHTPIDKEKQVGRWKLIEQELMARNLPVTGSRLPQAKARIDN